MERRGRVQKGQPVGWSLWDMVERARDSQEPCDVGRGHVRGQEQA